MPYSAIGLIWNSMVSVAGGWFFLIVCEMFPLGDRNFRLPGLGSYIQTAASTSPVDMHALLWGLAVLVLIIVATDQLIWRPLIAWSDKFKFEQVESTDARHLAHPLAAAAVEFLDQPARTRLGFDRGADVSPPGRHPGMPRSAAGGR